MKTISKNYKKVYIKEVNFSLPDDHYGVYARQDISAGETVFIAKGKLVKVNIKNSADSQKFPNAIGYKPDYWLNPKSDNPLVFLNHSCQPNTGIKGRVTFVALKKIKKDEEITVDYSITETDTKWRLKETCQCGAKDCRGVIKSVQFLSNDIFTSYLPFIPRDSIRAYKSYKPKNKV